MVGRRMGILKEKDEKKMLKRFIRLAKDYRFLS